MGAHHRVRRIGERQQGVVTMRQALDAGLTRSQVRQLVSTGQWLSLRRAVFRVGGAPPGWEQAVVAACLAAGRPAYASHLTAGRVHGLRLPSPRGLELLREGDFRIRLAGVRHHRTGVLPPADVTAVRGVPVTTVPRTIHDVGGTLSSGQLERAVGDAVRRGILRIERLRQVHGRLARGPGRRAHRQLAALLARRADDWNPGDSEWEAWVLDQLLAAGLPVPVQQQPVSVGRHRYYLDFAYPEALLAVEFDGFSAHGDIESFHADRARWRRLAGAGWRIVWVTSRTSAAELVDAVATQLAASGDVAGGVAS
jgi:very-short-patch-repair endonuclease